MLPFQDELLVDELLRVPVPAQQAGHGEECRNNSVSANQFVKLQYPLRFCGSTRKSFLHTKLVKYSFQLYVLIVFLYLVFSLN